MKGLNVLAAFLGGAAVGAALGISQKFFERKVSN